MTDQERIEMGEWLKTLGYRVENGNVWKEFDPGCWRQVWLSETLDLMYEWHKHKSGWIPIEEHDGSSEPVDLWVEHPGLTGYRLTDCYYDNGWRYSDGAQLSINGITHFQRIGGEPK